MTDVAYVTYRPDRPDPDVDIPLALPAMERLGLTVETAIWDDPEVDWSAYRLVLVRSAWDYTMRHDDFLAWAAKVDGVSKLRNPYAVLERNTDKRYLAELEIAGVPIVPTAWIEGGHPDVAGAAEAALALIHGDRWVVKPAVSAGARDTILTSDPLVAQAHATTVAASGKTVMLQPYLHAVDHEGETAIVVLGGEVSHAVRKVPALTVGGFGDAAAAVEVTDQMRQLVDAALAEEALRDQLVYARVDVVPDDDGRLVIMELELTEPTLFLPYDEAAPERLASAVRRALDD